MGLKRRIAAGAVSAVIVMLGCARRTEQSPLREQTVHMYGHFGYASEVQKAVIRGDVEAAHAPARWLAEHEEMEGLPKGSEPYVAELRRAAALAVEAKDLNAAAAATAAIASSCGACHARFDAGPRLAPAAQPPKEQGTGGHMSGHVWAADRLWEGLIAPSTPSWVAGARALAQAPLTPQEITGDADRAPAVAELERRVHETGARAERTADAKEQARLFGELLTSCSSCHRLVR